MRKTAKLIANGKTELPISSYTNWRDLKQSTSKSPQNRHRYQHLLRPLLSCGTQHKTSRAHPVSLCTPGPFFASHPESCNSTPIRPLEPWRYLGIGHWETSALSHSNWRSIPDHSQLHQQLSDETKSSCVTTVLTYIQVTEETINYLLYMQSEDSNCWLNDV